jgi:hypothetical protein
VDSTHSTILEDERRKENYVMSNQNEYSEEFNPKLSFHVRMNSVCLKL